MDQGCELDASTRAESRRQSATRFYAILTAVALGALMFRIAYVSALRHNTIAPDGYYYHLSSIFVRHGKGFVNPFNGRPDATHPPAWPLVLTLPVLLGRASILSGQLLAVFIGSATVVVVGLAGRRVSSDRGGLIAATLAALYPGLWVYEQRLLSETLLFLLVATAIIVAYRYRANPSRRTALILGGLCGLLALTRAEQLLLVPFLLVPLILGWRWRRFSRNGVGSLVLACVMTVITILPWTLYNRGRIDQPVLLSTNFGNAMAQGNCGDTYSGPNLGYFDLRCPVALLQAAAQRGTAKPAGDWGLRRAAVTYMLDHIGRLPVVLIARQGRVWSLYKPFETLKSQAQFPQNPWWPQGVDLFFYWALIPTAVLGGAVLRRRRVSLLPLLAPFVITVVTVAMTYGEPRLRAGAEVPLVLLAAVGVEKLSTLAQRKTATDRVAAPRHQFSLIAQSRAISDTNSS